MLVAPGVPHSSAPPLAAVARTSCYHCWGGYNFEGPAQLIGWASFSSISGSMHLLGCCSTGWLGLLPLLPRPAASALAILALAPSVAAAPPGDGGHGGDGDDTGDTDDTGEERSDGEGGGEGGEDGGRRVVAGSSAARSSGSHLSTRQRRHEETSDDGFLWSLYLPPLPVERFGKRRAAQRGGCGIFRSWSLCASCGAVGGRKAVHKRHGPDEALLEARRHLARDVDWALVPGESELDFWFSLDPSVPPWAPDGAELAGHAPSVMLAEAEAEAAAGAGDEADAVPDASFCHQPPPDSLL